MKKNNNLGNIGNAILILACFLFFVIGLLYFTGVVLEASGAAPIEGYPGPEGYIPMVVGYPGPGPKNTPSVPAPTATTVRPTSTPDRPPTSTPVPFCDGCMACSTVECYQRCILECGCYILDPQQWVCPGGKEACDGA